MIESLYRAGRPKVNVDIDEILELRRLHYNWTKIAYILGISRATLYRRLEAAGVSPNDYTPLTDSQLDNILVCIKRDHQNDGEVLLQGHLVRQGIRVSRQALRNSIHRVDHENTIARRRTVIRRRVYSVPYPNYMWHQDGHHKLIRWRIVTHGAIDGYSRMITFMKSSNNNKAATVLDNFRDAVVRFGLPEHVRSDYGGENAGVWKFMITTHNNDYSCVITGSSVHNERIERMWRDVNRCVISMFADTFRNMEQDSILDPLNEVDLYCLHYLYIPRLNKAITEFQESWNNHALSRKGAMTPYQLHFEGLNYMVQNFDHSIDILDANVDTSQLVGDHVSIPRMKFVPCTTLKQSLQLIDPLEFTTDSGRTLYCQIIQNVGQHLSAGCNHCTT